MPVQQPTPSPLLTGGDPQQLFAVDDGGPVTLDEIFERPGVTREHRLVVVELLPEAFSAAPVSVGLLAGAPLNEGV